MKYYNNYINIQYGNYEEERLVLDELIENGLAEKYNDCVQISWEEIHNLTHIEQIILGLPNPYPYDMKVRTKDIFQSNDFDIIIEFFNYNHGDMLICKRTGAILELDNEVKYLLSKEQHEICIAVERFKQREDKSNITNLSEFSFIQKLSKEAKILLDSVFEKEVIVVPEKISAIPIKNEDGTYSIFPKISNISDQHNSSLQERFNKLSKVRTIYPTMNADGTVIKIPFSDIQKKRTYNF